MISLTVGLPMYRSKKIAWLAMESLVNQKNIDFEWELIIAEEKCDLFGEDNIRKYEELLKKVGCVSIKYIPLEDRISLSVKWRLLALSSDSNSRCFVIQSSDDYSSPNRLKNSLIMMDNGIDWIRNKKMIFYNFNDKSLYLLDLPNDVTTGGEMAVRTSIIRNIPYFKKYKHVDSWLFNSCKKINNKLKTDIGIGDGWRYSLHSYGMNNISKRDFKKKYKKMTKYVLSDIVPGNISLAIKNLK